MDDLQLFCLVEGDSTVFAVTLARHNKITDLKKRIHEEGKEGILRGIDAKDLQLWMVEVALNDDSESSLSSLVINEGDKSVQKLMAWKPVSEYWEKQPGNTLSVLVKLPAAPSRKRGYSTSSGAHESKKNRSEEGVDQAHKRQRTSTVDRRNSGPHSRENFVEMEGSSFERLLPGESTNHLLSFHKSFWGNPLPEEHVTLKAVENGDNDDENNENDDDLLPKQSNPILKSDLKDLFIRSEYLRIYEYVANADQPGKHLVVVTGQPGIGKTYWWYYALRRRIGDKKPILLYQGENSYLFCSAGVLVVPTSQGFRFNSRMWTLIDSVNASTGFPENMNTLVANIFPIYITSPQQKRWSSAVQFWSVHRVIMNPWTRAEMEYAAIHLYPQKELSDVLQKYDILGPTARLCLHSTDVTDYLKSRTFEIKKMHDLTSARSFFEQLLEHGETLSLDSMSHKICLIRRLQQRNVYNTRFTVGPVSESVTKELSHQLENLSEDQLLEMWRGFSNFGDARGMTGSVFEAYIHRQFQKEIKLEATPMLRGARADSLWYASFSLKIPVSAKSSARSIPPTTIRGHKTCVYYKGTLKVETDTYYIPRSGQQVGLDAFILHMGILYIFQCTGGRKHSIKKGLVSFLQSCEGIPSVDQWRFIFVVPDDLDSFSCPASGDAVISKLNPYTVRISV